MVGVPKKTITCSLIAHQRRRISKIRSVKHLKISCFKCRTQKNNCQKIDFSFFFGPFWVLFWPVLSSLLTLLSFLWVERLRPCANQHTGHIQGIMEDACNNKKPKKLSKFGPNLPPHHPQQADTVPALIVCLKIGHAAADCPTVQNCRTQAAHIYIYELTPINPLNGS